MSFARKHMERVLAEKAAQAASGDASTGENSETMKGLSIYEQMLAQLQTHSAQLKNIQSREDKVALKRTFVGDYNGYVDGVLAAESGVQDDVLMTQMVWRLDVGDFEGAYLIATHALEHDLALPERFKRTLPTYVAEQFAEAAIQADGQDDMEAPTAALLMDLLQDVADKDMPDQVRAKLHKALAFRQEQSGDPETMLAAVTHFERALRLDPKSGVKKRREQLERKLDKATKAET